MKTLSSYFLILILVGFSLDASAIVVPKDRTKQVIVNPQPHKLSLKEKTALWILRRKVKKKLRKHIKWNRNAVDTTDCDRILLKTGDQLDVRIIKISEESVRFVRCGETSELVLSKDDISEVLLSDGIVVYKNLNKTSKKPKSNSSDAGRVVLIVLGILGGIILLWLLFVLALISSL